MGLHSNWRHTKVTVQTSLQFFLLSFRLSRNTCPIDSLRIPSDRGGRKAPNSCFLLSFAVRTQMTFFSPSKSRSYHLHTMYLISDTYPEVLQLTQYNKNICNIHLFSCERIKQPRLNGIISAEINGGKIIIGNPKEISIKKSL